MYPSVCVYMGVKQKHEAGFEYQTIFYYQPYFQGRNSLLSNWLVKKLHLGVFRLDAN